VQSKYKAEVSSLQEDVERLTEKLKKKQERCCTFTVCLFTKLYVRCLFSKTTWVSWLRKVNYPMVDWQWHQMDHVQIICTLLQRNNHDSNIFTSQMLLLMPSVTEGSL